MSRPTHIRELDGFVRGALKDSVRPYRDQIRFSLNNLNGSSSWAYALWRAPADADLLDDIPGSEEYIQCAGSAQAMTIEVRVLDQDGVAHQYVAGKPGHAQEGPPTEVIHRDDGRHSSTVYPNEVFTADEAADVVYGYFLHDKVEESLSLREIDLAG